MKKINFFRTGFMALTLAVAMPMSFTACSSDDDDNKDNTETTLDEDGNPATAEQLAEDEQDKKITSATDGLAYFQDAITAENSNKQLLYYRWGTVLYPSDAGHLYIGVDDFAEAKKIFKLWISTEENTATITENSDGSLDATLKKEDGTKQLIVYLKKGTGNNVAEVTVSDESKIRHFDKITFMLNSAWPVNAESKKWHLGDKCTVTLNSDNNVEKKLNDKDKKMTFVCIRTEKNGTKPMFVSCTKHTNYKCGYSGTYPTFSRIRFSGWAPWKSTAKTITSLINEDWDLLCDAINSAHGSFNASMEYWIDYKPGTSSIYWYTWTYEKGGEGTKHNYQVGHGAPFLLYFDCKSDSEIYDGMTIKVSRTEPSGEDDQ